MNALANTVERLALGTAQLGMSYGIANRMGKPDNEAASKIVQIAWNSGVRFFDTAQAYGDSERVLGQVLGATGASADSRVVTKLRAGSPVDDECGIARSVEQSLSRLGVNHVWGLLLHDERQLDLWTNKLHPQLRRLVEQNKILRLGVSVYSPDRALQALSMDGIQAVQVASNLFDRRLIRNGFFTRASLTGQTVFVRSIYLQGLALMDTENLPDVMAFARKPVAIFHAFCRQHNLAPAQFALDYVRSRTGSATILVMGAETAAQMSENVSLFNQEPINAELMDAWDKTWPEDDPMLIDPSRWPR